jgi:hypothetical protein
VQVKHGAILIGGWRRGPFGRDASRIHDRNGDILRKSERQSAGIDIAPTLRNIGCRSTRRDLLAQCEDFRIAHGSVSSSCRALHLDTVPRQAQIRP